MKRKLPKTFAYLKRFEDRLRVRSGFKQYFRPTDPFYSIYNVGPYTMADWKVLWPEVGHTVRAGVCGPAEVEAAKPALPDHTIVAVSCGSKQEAHFICALLNSAPAQLAASGYIVLHPSPHILEHIAIPSFNAKDQTHKLLARLSEKCHLATSNGDTERVGKLEMEIDEAAASVWGITDTELKAIQSAIADKGAPGRASAQSDREDGDE